MNASNFPPLHPTFSNIPLRMIFSALTGTISAKISGSSARLWATISVISALAEDVLYLGLIQVNDRNRKWTYILTHAIVSTVEIIALRKFDLIARNGTLVVSGYAILRCAIFSGLNETVFHPSTL